MNALEKLDARWANGARICVGLDTDFELIPDMFRNNGVYSGIRAFNGAIIGHTKNLALAYKMNLADYLEHGPEGLNALIYTCTFIHREAPEVLTIIDCKFGDALDDKNAKYAKFAFDVCGADAMTAQIYAGGDAAKGFTRYADKLVFFLCKTSNPGSGEFQDLPVGQADEKPLYEVVARQVDSLWNKHRNCGLVVGATTPEEMQTARKRAWELPILAPGVGKQAGSLESTVRAGLVPRLGRLIVNESRSLIYAPYDKRAQRDEVMTFAQAAQTYLAARTAEYNKILAQRAA